MRGCTHLIRCRMGGDPRNLPQHRDLLVEDIPDLKSKYGAVAGDWERGAIAWVAKQNSVRCLILRGVTDLVDDQGSQAYGNLDYFTKGTREIMGRLVEMLPEWLVLI